MQFLQGQEIRGDVLAYSGVRATSGFNRPNPLRRQCLVLHQKFAILLREDIVGDRCNIELGAHVFAQLQHQRSLPTSDRAPYPNGECTARIIAVQWLVAIMKMARMVEMLVCVSMSISVVAV